MKKRQVVIVLGILILIGGYLGGKWIAGLKEPPKKEKKADVARKLPVVSFQPDTVVSRIPVTGRVQASQKVEVYAEVSGVLQKGSHPFKEGIEFRKGEVLVSMDDREASMDLRSLKSQFLNAITELLPDLKLDFPEAYSKWKEYLASLDVDRALPPLPEVEDQQVKYFVASRNLFDRYYSIKSREVRLDKYNIEAPFTGVLTSSNIDPGTLVRVGQKLGEFIDPDHYEVVFSIGVQDISKITIGDTVFISTSEMSGKWKGTVDRINGRLDPGTQTIEVFVGLTDNALRDGMYMDGWVRGKRYSDAVMLPRKLLMDEEFVWTIRDSTLHRTDITLLHTMPQKVIIQGLDARDKVLEQPFPGAYEGMPAIPVYSDKNDEPAEKGKKAS